MQHSVRDHGGRHRAGLPVSAAPGRHRAVHRTARRGWRGRSSVAIAIAAATAAVGLMIKWPTVDSRAVVDADQSTRQPSQPRPGLPAPRADPEADQGVDIESWTGRRGRDVISRAQSRQRTDRTRSPAAVQPPWLAACAAMRTSEGSGNGLLSDDQLCELPDSGGQHLRSDAARAWWLLDLRYRRQFQESLCVTDSYRSLSEQQALRVAKPGLAAAPGTSNHGWATALDLCGGVESFGTDSYQWMASNGPALGWVNPSWAQRYGSKPEPWHWEFSPS